MARRHGTPRASDPFRTPSGPSCAKPEQGIKAVRDACERAAAFKATAKKMGVKVSGIYWTLGAFDGVIVCEAPDEETAAAALLHLGSLGNTRTQTARAYDAAEMQKILGLLPKRVAGSPRSAAPRGSAGRWPASMIRRLPDRRDIPCAGSS